MPARNNRATTELQTFRPQERFAPSLDVSLLRRFAFRAFVRPLNIAENGNNGRSTDGLRTEKTTGKSTAKTNGRQRARTCSECKHARPYRGPHKNAPPQARECQTEKQQNIFHSFSSSL